MASTSLLKSINTRDISIIPKLKDIAELIAKITGNYIQSSGFHQRDLNRVLCELAVFGFCPVERELQIFSIRPEFEPTMSIRIDKLDTSEEDSVLLLGDRKSDVLSLIQGERRSHPRYSIPWWRAPSIVIKKCINDENFGTIGGCRQLGMGNEQGFDIKWIFEPIVLGEPAAKVNYLGLSVIENDLRLGPCYIGMTGMAMI